MMVPHQSLDFNFWNVPQELEQPGESSDLKPKMSMTTDESKVPFRHNGRDCFLNAISEPSSKQPSQPGPVEPRPYVPPYIEKKTMFTPISVIHHYHHYVPPHPVLLAPPVKPMYKSRTSFCSKDLLNQVETEPAETVTSMKEESIENRKALSGPICSHCQTDSTSLWRRIEDKLMCNACALYFKLHGIMRPLHLSTGIIKRRNRLGSVAPKRQRRYKC